MIPALITSGTKLAQGVFTVSAALGPVLLIGMAYQHIHYEGWPIFGGGEIARIETQRDLALTSADKWKTAHTKQVEYFAAAKKAGEAAAQAARDDYDQAARRADNAQYEIDKLRDAARRYAAAARVQNPRRYDQGGPAEADPATGGNGPGDDAGLYGVFVTRNDFDILVENSLRMQKVHGWATDLIDRGRAAPVDWPEPEFGK